MWVEALRGDTGNFADELEDVLGSGFNVEDDGASTGPDLYLGYAFSGASFYSGWVSPIRGAIRRGVHWWNEDRRI